MKNIIRFILSGSLLLVFLCLTLVACSNDEGNNTVTADDEENAGVFAFHFTFASCRGILDPGGEVNKTNDGVQCQIFDQRDEYTKIEVSMDEVIAGQTDNLEWITVYCDDLSRTLTDRCAEAYLEPGTYKSVKITRLNRFEWIIRRGAFNRAIPDYFDRSDINREYAPALIFGPAGRFTLDANNKFILESSLEEMPEIDVSQGHLTRLECRLNYSCLEWSDNDGNCCWSDGDELDQINQMAGVETLYDFRIINR